MDWSYDLLDSAEESLFRGLSIFTGGCTLEAVEHVCSDEGVSRNHSDSHSPLILNHLAALVDKSLVLVEDERYRMLETVREYARQKLGEEMEEDELGRRHRDWSLEFVEKAEPELTGHNQLEWFDRLELEMDNLRNAVSWSRTEGETTEAMRICGALMVFWGERRHYCIEILDVLNKVLAACKNVLNEVIAKAFLTKSWMRLKTAPETALGTARK